MLKKLLIVLLSLLLISCEKEVIEDKKEEEIIESKFIDPIKDVFLCDELNENIKNKWMEIINTDGGRGISNYQIEMLFKDIYEGELIDINGNTVDLNSYDKLVFNFVSTECGACKQEISECINDLVNEYEDVTFIQYFGIGEKEDILNMYSSLNVTIPDNLIIIAHNDDFHNYMKYDLKAEMYPTFVFFNAQKVSLVLTSKLSLKAYKKAYDLAFENPIRIEELINKDGIYLFDLNRIILEVPKNNEFLDSLLQGSPYGWASYTKVGFSGNLLNLGNNIFKIQGDRLFSNGVSIRNSLEYKLENGNYITY